ncbi:g4624 [Coccomyxa elongata]
MSKKRKNSGDLEGYSHGQDSCRSLFEQLQNELSRRVRETDEYVAEKSKELEEREAGSRAQIDEALNHLDARVHEADEYIAARTKELENREAASRAQIDEALNHLDARERELSKIERSVFQQSEQLQALRDEATKLYNSLVHQLPELQSRVEGASTAPSNASVGGAHRNAQLPPFPSQPLTRPAQASWQAAVDAHWGPRTGASAAPLWQHASPLGHGHQAAAGSGSFRPDQARPPQHHQHQHPPAAPSIWEGGSMPRSPPFRGVDHAPSRGAAASAFAGVDIRSGGRTPLRPPAALPQNGGPGYASTAPGRGAGPAGDVQQGSASRQASSNGHFGSGRDSDSHNEQPGGAPGTPGAGGQPEKGPGPAGDNWPQGRGAGAASGSGQAGRGTFRPHTRSPASAGRGRGMGKGFPFQMVTARGRNGAASVQQSREPATPRPAPAPDLAVGGRMPMERGRTPTERGRLARRGRGRQTPAARAGAEENCGSDSLEMAVRMLRAQNEPGAPASAEHGSDAPGIAGIPNADRAAGNSCGMARPVSPASLLAQPALQADAPALLDLLKERNILQHLTLLDPAVPDADISMEAGDGGPSTAKLAELYNKLHLILGRILAPLPVRRGSDREADPDANPGGAAGGANTGAGTGGANTGPGGAAAAERRDRYTLYALQCLIEAARKYETAAEAVRWGWCRELQAFVFVFEAANRIVVEKPEYANATYFFDMEEPLPVAAQVQRLVAVLSVPAVTRGALLTDGAPDLATGLPPADAAVLQAAGWTPENGLRSLLNFSGERIIHKITRGASEADTLQLYRDKITKLLSQGASAGRTYKPCMSAA